MFVMVSWHDGSVLRKAVVLNLCKHQHAEFDMMCRVTKHQRESTSMPCYTEDLRVQQCVAPPQTMLTLATSCWLLHETWLGRPWPNTAAAGRAGVAELGRPWPPVAAAGRAKDQHGDTTASLSQSPDKPECNCDTMMCCSRPQ